MHVYQNFQARSQHSYDKQKQRRETQTSKNIESYIIIILCTVVFYGPDHILTQNAI